jgi:hypothetical protein
MDMLSLKITLIFHLFIVVGIGSVMFASTRFLGHWCYWWWHVLVT